MDPKPAGPAPTRTSLHDAALHHLSRFSATEAGLVRVLDRRVQRWARLAEAGGIDPAAQAAAARVAVREVARALAGAGVIDDTAFAAARAARLARAGRSRRATAAHLVAKGVPPDAAAAALRPPEEEFAAALAFARRRRIGPFRPGGNEPEDADPMARQRELATLARAGFPRDVAERALDTDAQAAGAAVLALKRG